MNHLLPRAATLGALLLPSSTRGIAVNTPNNSLSSAWGGYRTTVDAIEAAGLDLLSALPMSVQNVMEAKTDAGPTN
jgi:endonuclease G